MGPYMMKWTFLLLFIFPLTGCSRETPRPSASFTGTVRLDGQPLEAGSIQFTSLQTGETAYANLDSSGHFQVHFPEADIGTNYDVTVGQPIQEMDAIDAMTASQTRKSNKAPPRYASRGTSQLTAKLSQEGENQVDFELTTQPK